MAIKWRIQLNENKRRKGEEEEEGGQVMHCRSVSPTAAVTAVVGPLRERGEDS